uniref:Uncharacterized protein n=1 Tax=Anopheles farauti TaxID=69004 RepID=A0A182PZL8_9DIPT
MPNCSACGVANPNATSQMTITNFIALESFDMVWDLRENDGQVADDAGDEDEAVKDRYRQYDADRVRPVAALRFVPRPAHAVVRGQILRLVLLVVVSWMLRCRDVTVPTAQPVQVQEANPVRRTIRDCNGRDKATGGLAGAVTPVSCPWKR